jgi:ComF family protein
VSWGDYRGALKRAIALLKYDNQPQIARPLGQWLGETWLSSHTTLPTVLVVPIPLYRAKEQQRGYNQAALIAHSFCDITGFPLRSQGLERVRKTAAQFGLSNLERERNLSQAFVLGRDFLQKSPGYPVLLLDDIYTTGATVRSAVKTLEQSGIQVSGLVVVAKAQLDRPQPAD